MSIDKFYPISETIRACPNGMWQISMVVKLESHLQAAKNGDRDAESRLVNRIGQLRRHFPEISDLPPNIFNAMRKACGWLSTNGRVFDLLNEDPALWVSQRGGAPRW